MSPVTKSFTWGICASAALFISFVISQILQAGPSRAVGIGALVFVFTQPLFWILLVAVLCATTIAAFKTSVPR